MKQLRDRSPAILISAFFAPVILLILVLMNLGVYPFGEGTFLRADMNSQYSANEEIGRASCRERV